MGFGHPENQMHLSKVSEWGPLCREFESLLFGALWKHQSEDQGKFLFYRSFKKDLEFKSYLEIPRSDARRDCTRLRISAHPLMIREEMPTKGEKGGLELPIM